MKVVCSLEAVRSGARKFVYVSVSQGEKFTGLRICREKERFVAALRNSGVDYRVIRPNGYFSDMAEYLRMARKGRVFVLGDGNNIINPISGRDLAVFCLQAMNGSEKEPEVGGPEYLSHNQIAELAFRACGRTPRITHIPRPVVRAMRDLLRLFTTSKVYGPVEFVTTMLSHNMEAPSFGKDTLGAYFRSLA